MDLFAQERDREVRNIVQSINDLAQIMKDLSVLVIDQGTIVDRIDYNMEQVGPLRLSMDDGKCHGRYNVNECHVLHVGPTLRMRVGPIDSFCSFISITWGS